MHYLYVLYSPKHDKYYVGETNRIDERIAEHNFSLRNTYTSKYRPWKLAALFEITNRSKAREIEIYIKKQKSKFFIQRLIERDFNNGILAQLVRVPRLRDPRGGAKKK